MHRWWRCKWWAVSHPSHETQPLHIAQAACDKLGTGAVSQPHQGILKPKALLRPRAAECHVRYLVSPGVTLSTRALRDHAIYSNHRDASASLKLMKGYLKWFHHQTFSTT